MKSFSADRIEDVLNTQRPKERLQNSRHVVMCYTIDDKDYALKFLSSEEASEHEQNRLLFTSFGMNFLEQKRVNVSKEKAPEFFGEIGAPVNNHIIITEFQYDPRMCELDRHYRSEHKLHEKMMDQTVPIVICDHWDMRAKNIFVGKNDELAFFDPEFGLATHPRFHYREHTVVETLTKQFKQYGLNLTRDEKIVLFDRFQKECDTWRNAVETNKINVAMDLRDTVLTRIDALKNTLHQLHA